MDVGKNEINIMNTNIPPTTISNSPKLALVYSGNYYITKITIFTY